MALDRHCEVFSLLQTAFQSRSLPLVHAATSFGYQEYVERMQGRDSPDLVRVDAFRRFWHTFVHSESYHFVSL